MLSGLRKIFGRSKGSAAKRPPPGPKPVTHPGLVAKMEREKMRAIGVGVVYDRNGVPKITEDFLRGLSHIERVAVDRNLYDHGWKIGMDESGLGVIPVDKGVTQ